MKKFIPLLVIAFITNTVIAQTANPYPKKITVSGSAEMEIVPDEIYVNVKLSEYQKKGESKVELETIKTKFLESCKAAGIADSLITIASYSGNNYYIRKKKPNDLFANITYQVKFKDNKLMDDLVDKLDDNATQSFQVAYTSHSKITEFRKQLKIKAIQAAKEKGIYLSEAIGEKLGETINIDEPDERPYYSAYSNSYANSNIVSQSRSNYSSEDNVSGAVDFKKIKLRYEVNVVFALK